MKKNKKNIPVKKENQEPISPEIDAASKIATHYGFDKLPFIEVEKEDIVSAKKFHESHLKVLHPFYEKNDRFGGFLEEKISLLRNFQQKKFEGLSMPLSGFYKGPLKGNPHMKKNADEETFNLEVLGSSKSITEALIIETAYVILKNRYPHKELSLEINSIGDKESLSRFIKELGNYLKKEQSKLSKKMKEAIKKDIFNFFCFEGEADPSLFLSAPKTMSYLSESSRTHFKEVLEYIESLEIPYVINHTLIGSRSYCSDTVFEITGTEKGKSEILAIGERYNGLAKKALGKKDTPSIGVALLLHPHFVSKRAKKEKVLAPKFFFIQLGFSAKLQSLKIMEILRQANIPVEQSLSKDKLSLQLATAEKMNIPYIIMLGQKEAIEHSVVVRELKTMSQETIPLDNLVSYLKKLP